MLMNFFKRILNAITGKVSDEEFDKLIEENNAVQCPKCKTFVGQNDLISNDYICPVCNVKIETHNF